MPSYFLTFLFPCLLVSPPSYFLSMLLIYFCICLFVCYALLIAYYRFGWMQLPSSGSMQKPSNTYATKVSVIIPARNETANIANCIRSVLAQNYPQQLIEIIVVDDHSADNTVDIVTEFVLAYPNVQVLELAKGDTTNAYKKKAIEKGIGMATGTLIVATDADCEHGKHWIESIVQAQNEADAQFIAAPVVFTTENNFLSVFQTLDFMTLQGITAASVFLNFHTMCNGANLAYTKQSFTDVNGFAGIDNIPTGDDMLLMHKIYSRYPTQVIYLKSKAAITSTPPAESWKGFFNQRIRWASKATHYDDKRIFTALLLVYLFNVSFLVLLIASLFSTKFLLAFFILIGAKTLVELWFLIPVAKFFSKSGWLPWFPFLQPAHIGYTIIAGWLGKFGKYEWKGRTVVAVQREKQNSKNLRQKT